MAGLHVREHVWNTEGAHRVRVLRLPATGVGGATGGVLRVRFDCEQLDAGTHPVWLGRIV